MQTNHHDNNSIDLRTPGDSECPWDSHRVLPEQTIPSDMGRLVDINPIDGIVRVNVDLLLSISPSHCLSEKEFFYYLDNTGFVCIRP